jgi:hypothetical protein
MKVHPTTVEGFDGSLQVLGNRMAELRYDQLAALLFYFAQALLQESNRDRMRGRIKLSLMLTGAWSIARMLQLAFEGIFFFSAPHMKAELGERPGLPYDDPWKKREEGKPSPLCPP